MTKFYNYIKESNIISVIKRWVLDQINSYYEDKRPSGPFNDYVFRVTNKKEWDNIKNGYFSSSFWSSDPTEYMNYLENGDILLVAKSSGPKKFRGKTKHYHNLDKKLIDDIILAYEIKGNKPNIKLSIIKNLSESYLNEARKVWYHGAYTDNIKKFVTNNEESMGIYFSDNKDVAANMHGGVPYIYTVKLNLRKTLDLTKYKEGSENAEEFLKELPVSDFFIRNTIFNSGDVLLPYKYLELANQKEDIIPKLKKNGYDSIQFKEDKYNTMVVFNFKNIEILKVDKINNG